MLKRNILLTFKLAAVAGLLATAVSSWQSYSAQGFVAPRNVVNGLIDGFLIVGLVAAYKLMLTDVLFRRWFARLNFARTLLLNSIGYSFLILLGRALGRFMMESESFILFPVGDEIAKTHFVQALSLSLVFSIFFNFLLQNSRLLGPRVMANFITGRYHNARHETRIVLFMDLKSSTTIAEKLGDKLYLEFLSDAFADLTEAILSTGAEIYKYVGDEVILTWGVSEGIKHANCLALPLMVERLFRENAPRYTRRYGYVPQFRTGIHVGELVIGEVGVLKREIALIGDVMNTAARVAAHSRETGHDILISTALRDLLPANFEIQLKSLGPIKLRGKTEPMEIFAVFS